MTTSSSTDSNAVALQLILARLESIDRRIHELGKTPPKSKKTWLQPAEFAAMAGVTPKTLRQWVANGRLSAQAHRKVKEGSNLVHQYHAQIAAKELDLI